jgi:hypothetical protein
MKHLIKYLNQCFRQGFSKFLEKGNGLRPILIFSKVLDCSQNTL